MRIFRTANERRYASDGPPRDSEHFEVHLCINPEGFRVAVKWAKPEAPPDWLGDATPRPAPVVHDERDQLRTSLVLLDRGEHEGRAFAVFEWFDADLARWSAVRRPFEDRLRAATGICECVAALHRDGQRVFPHRLVHPTHFLIRGQGEDLQVAFAHIGGGSPPAGAPCLAPERHLPPPADPQPWSDTYPLGAVVAHCLLGALPKAVEGVPHALTAQGTALARAYAEGDAGAGARASALPLDQLIDLSVLYPPLTEEEWGSIETTATASLHGRISDVNRVVSALGRKVRPHLAAVLEPDPAQRNHDTFALQDMLTKMMAKVTGAATRPTQPSMPDDMLDPLAEPDWTPVSEERMVVPRREPQAPMPPVMTMRKRVQKQVETTKTDEVAESLARAGNTVLDRLERYRTAMIVGAGFVVVPALGAVLYALAPDSGAPAVSPAATTGTQGSAWVSPSVDYTMAWVDPGSFLMGSPKTDQAREEDEVQHRVTLSQGYWLGVTEVTQAQWQEVMGSNPSNKSYKKVSLVGPQRPVQNVRWCDAVVFANALSERDGLTPAYTLPSDVPPQTRTACNSWSAGVSWNPGASGYRLPSEAEWAFAARAGGVHRRHAGDGSICTIGNVATEGDKKRFGWSWTVFPCDDKVSGLAEVKSYPANQFGLHDMTGNVWEWCWDWFDDLPSTEQKDPAGPVGGSDRVLRGGSWYSKASATRLANRYSYPPGHRDPYIGLRLARSAPP